MRQKLIFSVLLLILVIGLFFLILRNTQSTTSNYQKIETSTDTTAIENGVHINTGLIEAEGLHLVIAHCTSCHSAKLITQNRLSKEGWQETIKWMQETQNLWDLGNDEEAVVNYLAKNYAPTDIGRRASLKNIEWYSLKD